MAKCEFLQSFVYCPKCGGEFVDNNIKSKRCTQCGFTFYFNPSAAVVAIIKDADGRILVSTRGKEPAKGSYDLPGGFVDSYESAEESVRREVSEECHLEVTSTNYLFTIPNIYRYSNFDVHTLDIFFECSIGDMQTIKADDDVSALQFIAIEDIDISQFGLISIQKGLKRYLEMNLHPYRF
ncbi:MAG: NUDIX domain-containing protein [Rikenellaceae bacterium]